MTTGSLGRVSRRRSALLTRTGLTDGTIMCWHTGRWRVDEGRVWRVRNLRRITDWTG